MNSTMSWKLDKALVPFLKQGAVIMCWGNLGIYGKKINFELGITRCEALWFPFKEKFCYTSERMKY